MSRPTRGYMVYFGAPRYFFVPFSVKKNYSLCSQDLGNSRTISRLVQLVAETWGWL